MQKRARLSFLITIIFYFIGMLLKNDSIQFIFKPLIVSSLLFYFILSAQTKNTFPRNFVISALIFSAIGDTLLLLSNNNEIFFILGLIAFLVAHIFYIITFHNIKTKEGINGRWYTAFIVAIYFVLIMGLLSPHLGSLKIPVYIYGVVISFMLFVALQLYDVKYADAGQYIVTGAVFFVASDSILAVNKFYHPVAWGAWATMITYVLAQWFIVEGVIRYLKSPQTLPQ